MKEISLKSLLPAFMSSSLAFSALANMPAFAIIQTAQQNVLSQTHLKMLDSLEERFLFNKHPSLSVEKRIEALEVEVFGEIKKGALKERISALQRATTGYEQPSLDTRTETILSTKPNKSGDSHIVEETVKQNKPETDSADNLLEKATLLFRKGDISSAESTLKKVLVLDKHNADAYFNLGAIAEAKADLDSAVEEYQHCLEERPDDKEAQEALSSVKARRVPLDGKSANSITQNKPARHVDYPLAQHNAPQGKTYSTAIPTVDDVLFVSAAATWNLPYIYWRFYRGGGILARWLSRTYPDFKRSSYDHKVAILALDSSNGWTSNNPLGIKVDGPMAEDLAQGDYKVAISAVGNVVGALHRHDDREMEAVQEFLRNGGDLVVTGYDLRVLPELVPEIIGCYSSQSWNQKNGGVCVDAELTKAAAPLGKGLSDNSRWCIPFKCPMIKILDPSRVFVLAVSQFVKARDPEGDGVLAALIPYGKGNILCVAGNMCALNAIHVTDSDPKMHIPLLDGLAINFIVSGLRGSPIQTGASHS